MMLSLRVPFVNYVTCEQYAAAEKCLSVWPSRATVSPMKLCSSVDFPHAVEPSTTVTFLARIWKLRDLRTAGPPMLHAKLWFEKEMTWSELLLSLVELRSCISVSPYTKSNFTVVDVASWAVNKPMGWRQ